MRFGANMAWELRCIHPPVTQESNWMGAEYFEYQKLLSGFLAGGSVNDSSLVVCVRSMLLMARSQDEALAAC
jgi:hypothetical protein